MSKEFKYDAFISYRHTELDKFVAENLHKETEVLLHAYYGPDAAGRIYLLGTHGCFILNQDMNPIAWVPNALNVDVEEQKIYLKYGSYSYVSPVYTTEELLKFAEESK